MYITPTEQAYRDIQKKLEELYPDDYITDECVDSENCRMHEYDGAEYWEAMLRNIHLNAGARLEERDMDIPDFIEY